MAALPTLGDGQNNLLRKITENTFQSVFPFLPADWSVRISYYGSTNNIKELEFLYNGVLQRKYTITYVNGAVADDDNIAEIV